MLLYFNIKNQKDVETRNNVEMFHSLEPFDDVHQRSFLLASPLLLIISFFCLSLSNIISLSILFSFLSCCFCFLALQTRQPVFVQLLQGVFRVYHCNWLVPAQKASVESCIKVLSDVGKYLTMTIQTLRNEPHTTPFPLSLHPASVVCFK